jgi:hypothetical protein
VAEEAEVHSICRKYESFRLRNESREKYLLSSILQYGVREPLLCAQNAGEQQHRYVLLDGFKRLRCCRRLQIEVVPVASLGADEVDSILKLIRASTDRSLTTLEQARFVDELHGRCGLSVSEIAAGLERSKAWVSVRLGIIGRMSPVVRDAVFSGRFPLRSYMYTLQPFTRVNGIPCRAIDNFVSSVAGKGLSTRQIEKLAYGYFRGGKLFKAQIEDGNLQWTLRRMDQLQAEPPADGMSEAEWNLVRDLELAQKYMVRILSSLGREDLGSNGFHAHALLLIEGLLENIDRFAHRIRSFHDRRAEEAGGSRSR